jgi:hypothetical protein
MFRYNLTMTMTKPYTVCWSLFQLAFRIVPWPFKPKLFHFLRSNFQELLYSILGQVQSISQIMPPEPTVYLAARKAKASFEGSRQDLFCRQYEALRTLGQVARVARDGGGKALVYPLSRCRSRL